jgi:hypothetical protein
MPIMSRLAGDPDEALQLETVTCVGKILRFQGFVSDPKWSDCSKVISFRIVGQPIILNTIPSIQIVFAICRLVVFGIKCISQEMKCQIRVVDHS